jgi:rod shape-determining protein MreD
MARILFGTLIVVAAFAQATLLPAYNPFSIGPDFTLVLLLVWCVFRGLPEGLGWTFGLGLLMDVLAIDPLGTNGLALLPAALLGGLGRRRLFYSTALSPVMLAVVATILHAVVLLALRGHLVGGISLPALLRFVALQSVLNALLMPPLYFIASRLNRQIVTRRRRYVRQA